MKTICELIKDSRDYGSAKGTTLDRLGETRFITRKRLKTITLLFGWKLVKEEKDESYRKRMYNIMEMALEKQVPKKVRETVGDYENSYYCDRCGQSLRYEHQKYCEDCGGKQSW